MKKIKKIFNQKGFTLVELLAVLGIIVIVSVVASAIVFSSLRAANKANQVNIVRQNGNFAILQTSRTIRYAKSFNGVSQDNVKYSNDCTLQTQPSPSPSVAPSQVHYSSIKVTLFDESSITFSCVPPSSPTSLSENIDGQTSDLVDLNAVTVKDCYFTCTQNFLTDSPAIGINLSLSQASSTNFAEKGASISFNTTITMRNPNK